MKIGFLGLGKLGLPVALAIEQCGHQVTGCDINPQVTDILAGNKLPYREKGAQEALSTSQLKLVSMAALVAESDLIFVAIQTPHNREYEGITRLPEKRVDFDYAFLKAGVNALAKEIKSQNRNKIVALISTVLPGTIEKEIYPLLNNYVQFCYNPFFIAMGTAMDDFMRPEFVLIGAKNKQAKTLLKSFYTTIHSAHIYQTDIASAELIKVSYNTFISMKITFINTIMEICHKTEANIDEISNALSLADKRINSPAYLRGGMGDGGGCHPRDNIALSWLAQQKNLSYDFFESLMIAREKQTEWLAELMVAYNLPKVILGKSFKPESNIIIGSPALLLHNLLIEKNIDCAIYDPVVDHEPMPGFSPSVFLIGTQHKCFAEMTFPQQSVVIDPWRYISDQKGIKVIRVGE